MNDSISIYSYLQCVVPNAHPAPWHTNNSMDLIKLTKNNKRRNMNFHLGLNLFTLPRAWCPTSGDPWQSPNSLETSREKCATEWKSQHSQPSQIAIESIYSTLVKTPNQALIMRERVREREKWFLGNICRQIQRESQLLFLFTLLVDLAISGVLCALSL